MIFCFSATSTSEIYTLSLHDALPISANLLSPTGITVPKYSWNSSGCSLRPVSVSRKMTPCSSRSEEHTSELQSRRDLVCRLLLEKKELNLRILETYYRMHCLLQQYYY